MSGGFKRLAADPIRRPPKPKQAPRGHNRRNPHRCNQLVVAMLTRLIAAPDPNRPRGENEIRPRRIVRNSSGEAMRAPRQSENKKPLAGYRAKGNHHVDVDGHY